MPGSTARVSANRPNTLASNWGAYLLVHAFLEGCLVAVACIVHQHVDRAEACLGLGHRALDLGGIGDIQAERQHPVLGAAPEIGDARGIACRHHRTPAAIEHQLREIAPEARRAAGDEPDRTCLLCHLSIPP